jgi:hypothetical protein
MELMVEFFGPGVALDPELVSMRRLAAEQDHDSVQAVAYANGMGAGFVFIGAAGLSFFKKLVPGIFKWLQAREQRSISLRFGGVALTAKGANCQDSILKVLEVLRPIGSADEAVERPRAVQLLHPPELPKPIKEKPKRLLVKNKKAVRKRPVRKKKKKR